MAVGLVLKALRIYTVQPTILYRHKYRKRPIKDPEVLHGLGTKSKTLLSRDNQWSEAEKVGEPEKVSAKGLKLVFGDSVLERDELQMFEMTG